MRKIHRCGSVAVVVSLALLGACGDDSASSGDTTSTAASTSTSAAASTTTAATTASTTATTATTSTAGATTTATCAVTGSTNEVKVNFPQQLSSLVGTDIRTGAHDCYERVVIELKAGAPSGSPEMFPGYWVRYQDRPILDSPRGEPVTITGQAVLIVSLGSWMPDMQGNGYSGPKTITPTNVTSIKQLVQIENFEGMTQWAIGLDAKRPFTVTTLADPNRLVIDIQT